MKENDREETERVFGEETGAIAENSDMEEGRQTQTISEEQARALLEQERIETEQRLKKAGSQRKKVLTLVIVAAVFLAAIAIGVGLLANREKRDEEKSAVGEYVFESLERAN